MSTAWAVLFVIGGVNHLCAPVWCEWLRTALRARRQRAVVLTTSLSVTRVAAPHPRPYPVAP